mmetsp:Transcript_5960/g.15851  ORF Transcript_5960/g.15851 Transcript_5960/m.15851 type:complete len:413 (-) Transcript_5960:3-1241(-)
MSANTTANAGTLMSMGGAVVVVVVVEVVVVVVVLVVVVKVLVVVVPVMVVLVVVLVVVVVVVAAVVVVLVVLLVVVEVVVVVVVTKITSGGAEETGAAAVSVCTGTLLAIGTSLEVPAIVLPFICGAVVDPFTEDDDATAVDALLTPGRGALAPSTALVEATAVFVIEAAADVLPAIGDALAASEPAVVPLLLLLLQLALPPLVLLRELSLALQLLLNIPLRRQCRGGLPVGRRGPVNRRGGVCTLHLCSRRQLLHQRLGLLRQRRRFRPGLVLVQGDGIVADVKGRLRLGSCNVLGRLGGLGGRVLEEACGHGLPGLELVARLQERDDEAGLVGAGHARTRGGHQLADRFLRVSPLQPPAAEGFAKDTARAHGGPPPRAAPSRHSAPPLARPRRVGRASTPGHASTARHAP